MNRTQPPTAGLHSGGDADRTGGAPLRARRAAVIALAVLSMAGAACSSGSPSGSAASTESIVVPPSVTVRNCNYVLGSTAVPSAIQGTAPDFPPFTPDQAAVDALHGIRAQGGTGLVAGYQLQTGTALYAGPDSSSSPVTTLAQGRSILVSDPVLWTTSSGAYWLAFFVACGGDNLYWVSAHQVSQVDPATGAQLARTIPQLLAAKPYTSTGEASALPIMIDAHHQLAWVDPKVRFPVGRGEYLPY